MKKFVSLLSIVMMLVIGISGMFAKMPPPSGIVSPITLTRHLPISIGPRPSRAPAHDSLSLVVVYNQETSLLEFNDETDDEVDFQVNNSNGVDVLSGSCSFDNEGCYSVSVSSLESDTYTIMVIVNGVEYLGEFELSND